MTVMYKTAEGCERCTYDRFVPHYNCRYDGKAIGHCEDHCTASGCY